MDKNAFELLKDINSRPRPFEFYTADLLWTDKHTSEKMLAYHLNESLDLSSRNRDFIEKSASWIISRFKLDAKTHVIDFGCGPGLYTQRFAETGARVTGVDFSQRSVDYARQAAKKKGLEINYVRQNYLEYDTKGKEGQCDLVTMIFCDFCALSQGRRKTLLEKFKRLLKPGGSVLLDAHTFNTYNAVEEKAVYEFNQLDRFWSAQDYYGFLNTFKYEEEKITLDKYTIIEEDRLKVVYNWLQHFSRETLSKEFSDAGFEVEAFYSDVAGAPFSPDSPDMAVVAKKPGLL